MTLPLSLNQHETQLDLDPLDGGTDAGFTFTSPNFPTAPPGCLSVFVFKYKYLFVDKVYPPAQGTTMADLPPYQVL